MSEYQYIHFMALDKPLNDKQLEYMERQSSPGATGIRRVTTLEARTANDANGR